MRILVAFALILATSPVASAANGKSHGHGAAAARAAPVSHSTFRMPVQPAYRPPVQHQVGHIIPQITATHGTPPSPAFHQRIGMTQPAARVNRPVARHVRLHGGVLAVPAVVAFGAPVLLQVPGIGPVSVPEDRYRALYDLLASENAGDWERAYTDLQRIQRETPSMSVADNGAARNSGPINMLPPVGSRSATSDSQPDLTERWNDLPRRERGLW
jgi:hypothetical protein